MIALAVFPWLVMLILNFFAKKGGITGSAATNPYQFLLLGYYLGFFIPLSSLYLGVGLISAEIEGGTLPYLFTRPVIRSLLFLAKFAGAFSALAILVLLSQAGSYALSLAVADFSGQSFMDFLAAAGVSVLGVLVYGAIFSFFGVVFRNPYLVGFPIGFGWENLAGWLPGFFKRLTVIYHLHELLPYSSLTGGLQDLLYQAESRWVALAFLFGYGVVFLLLSSLTISSMEVVPRDTEG
ncbi:MAG: ABC transporter permease [Candidatus Portnoybacteria bacterium]|nr:ABC transporter permease [Candidatus Portnoybacteria bacterium]